MLRHALRFAAVATLGAGLGLVACGRGTPTPTGTAGPTPADAKAFVEKADAELLDLSRRLSQAQWVSSNFITTDTEAISANTYQQFIAATMKMAKDAARFDAVSVEPDTKRRLELFKLASIPLPAPSNPAKQDELTKLAAGLEADYGRGKYCPPGKPCQDINAISKTMATSRNPAELLDAWRGWHAIAPPMKPRFERFVALGNEGARELGYKDLGALWRAGYDMSPDEFSAEVDRLWTQVKPLYDALHAHARRSLLKKYGPVVVPTNGPIPAHLLGNVWAQQWGNVYDLMGVPSHGSGYDLTKLLEAKKTDAKGMVQYGDRFFSSLGFQPMPATFWERSLFTKPQDRDVVCHASAWDVDQDQDLRIKMCIDVTGEDFVVIHHELGHNIYQRAYRTLPFIYRNSANDGFHEAIGDAIALSVTPDYLVKVGLLDQAPGPDGDLEYLMRMALDKVAFLPFGIVVDQWRWKVFSGEITPDKYNTAWWELRRKYQNVGEPEPRPADAFDPGAKYHVPANTPYTRYFLAHILQFQFQRAMCREAGYTGPLHRCSIYDNKQVGAKLAKMLEMGQSRPWPDALEALTGERKMDATAMLDYFKPLKEWLDAQEAAEKTSAPAPAPPRPHKPRDTVATRRRLDSPTMRTLIASLAAVLCAAVAHAQSPTAAIPATARPNIVFIMTDDHAAHAISAYGSKVNQTPNLDRLAKEGALFANVFATNSICTPSRATILTGQYSHLNGVTMFNRFDSTRTTVASLMQKAGYYTGMVGKWHLGSDPQGFDTWEIFPGQGDYNDPVLYTATSEKKYTGKYATDVVTDIALDFIATRPTDKPFFLMLHHKAPHRPWTPNAEHGAEFSTRTIPEPATMWDDYKGRTDALHENKQRLVDLTKTDVKQDPPAGLTGDALTKWKYQRYMQDYLATVQSVDDNVGRVLDALDKAGLGQNTIVIYTSDQGFFLGDHGLFDKRFMYEESIRMPFMVRWPAAIKAGTRIDAMGLNLDFAPTFLDAAGAPPSAQMQGRSLLPVMRGTTPRDWRTSMYYRYYHDPGHHNTRAHYGIRTKTHKLIYFWKKDQWELYDLVKDPQEMHNLYGQPNQATLTARLKTELARLKREAKDDDQLADVQIPQGVDGTVQQLRGK